MIRLRSSELRITVLAGVVRGVILQVRAAEPTPRLDRESVILGPWKLLRLEPRSQHRDSIVIA